MPKASRGASALSYIIPKKKMVCGGLGGIAPLVAGLVALEVAVLDAYIRQILDPDAQGSFYVFGYAIKAISLFSIGAFWAYLHRSERNLFKVFQLGIVAPSIILGLINSAEIGTLRKESRIERTTTTDPALREEALPDSSPARPQEGSWFSVISTAVAAEAACPAGTCPASGGGCVAEACEPSWYEKIWDGFLSRPPAIVVRCNENKVTAIIPSGSSVNVIENTRDGWCRFSIDGASSGSEIACPTLNATLVAPKNYAVSVRYEDGRCKFAVGGATDSH